MGSANICFGDILILAPWTDHGGKFLSLKGHLKSREAVGVSLIKKLNLAVV